jgi:iron-sulfur cluster repair protein YtfE (RIC family)
MTRYVILRDDGLRDAIAGQLFASYDEAYTVLERYSADFCCSDEREPYRIEAEAAAL